MLTSKTKIYFPAVMHEVYASPIDALTSLCVPNDEATDLVIASWRSNAACLLAMIDGGRTVAAIQTGDGQWAACNAYLGYASPSFEEAERQLDQILKRGKKGMIGMLPEKPGQD